MPAEKWECLKCKKATTSKDGFEQQDGRDFVTCSECGVKHQVVASIIRDGPNGEDRPGMRIAGLL